MFCLYKELFECVQVGQRRPRRPVALLDRTGSQGWQAERFDHGERHNGHVDAANGLPGGRRETRGQQIASESTLVPSKSAKQDETASKCARVQQTQMVHSVHDDEQ